jgi:hypothetical protein
MATCETVDFTYPLLADIYYPIVEQATYGNIKKQWILDKTVAANFNSAGSASKQEITPNVNITQESLLLGRVRTDIRISTLESKNSLTNIIISNIRDSRGNSVYNETSGPRTGKPTIFEIATMEPYVGPFGSVEFYKLIIRRSENQAVDI